MSPHFKINDWDSSFFGYTVATILSFPESRQALTESLRANHVSLAYYFSPLPDKEAEAIGARLVDEKIVFARQELVANSLPAGIETLPENSDFRDLLDLALESGQYSRFRLDENFRHDEFRKMYTEWIRKSVSHEIADVVYVYRQDGRIKGFVTGATKGEKMEIGLIAVDSSCRGRNIGALLLQAIEYNALSRGLAAIQVATQGGNAPAMRFYQKNGYLIDTRTYVYHLWL